MRTFDAPLTVYVLCLLAGCHQESSAPAQPQPAARPRAPAAAQRASGAKEQTAGMVEAATQGKSQLPVVLKFDLATRPTVGEPFEILLALVPGIPGGPAAVEATASAGLKLAEDSTRFEIPTIEAAQVYRQSLKANASAEGVLFVNLKVTLTHDQMSETRVFVLPVIVAAQPQAAQNPAN